MRILNRKKASGYLERALAKKVRVVSRSYKALLLTGPRQVGKTTLLKEMQTTKMNYVSLDDLSIRKLAQDDPRMFLMNYPAPLIIDEVQYAPNLLPYIKDTVDNSEKMGQYWLTGSQKFQLMKGVSESLAGRIGILEMNSLTYAEKHSLPAKLFDPYKIKKRVNLTPREVFAEIFQGGMPRLVTQKLDRKMFFDSYIKTYIERDVRDLTQVGDIVAFEKFIVSIAARTGEILNYHSIAEDAGIDEKTAKTWLSILVNNNVVYLLQPYRNSELKRVTKSPKIIFMDTGLCAYLCKWSSAEALMESSVAGHYLETYIVSELIKAKNNSTDSLDYDIYYYRDWYGKEIDLVLSFDNKLFPFEIKKTASPNKAMIKNFAALQEASKEVGAGGVICFYLEVLPLDEKNKVVPVGAVV